MRAKERSRYPTQRPDTRFVRTRAWALIAVALLAGGVVAGGLADKDPWAWTLPVGGFVAYVLAFRHALQLARPEGIDDLWRSRRGAAGEPHRLKSSELRNRARETNGQVRLWGFRGTDLRSHAGPPR